MLRFAVAIWETVSGWEQEFGIAEADMIEAWGNERGYSFERESPEWYTLVRSWKVWKAEQDPKKVREWLRSKFGTHRWIRLKYSA